MQFADLLAALGRKPSDLISISKREGDKLKLVRIETVAEAPTLAAGLTGDIYFGVNTLDPAKVALLEPGKRGSSDSVAQLDTLYADLDSKESGMGSEDRCRAFVEHLAQLLGAQPVAVVHTGTGGLHPYWKLDQPITASMLKAWGQLVKAEAIKLGGHADSVFDPARILRVPGSVRANGEPVRLEPGTERESVLATNLTDLVIPYMIETEKVSASQATFESWEPGLETCSYVSSMIDSWESESATDRHHWLLNKLHRLFAAARLGCITQDDFTMGQRAAIDRFRTLLATQHPMRAEHDNEIADIVERAKVDTETKTEEWLREQELGNHSHRTTERKPGSWQRKNMREALRDPNARPKPALWKREDGVFLLYPGCTHSVHGEPESGKSMLMQWEVAQQLTSGNKVLYLDYEDNEFGVGERLELMGVTLEQMEEHLYYLVPEQDYGSTPEDREAFEELLSIPFSMALIDGVTQAMLQGPSIVEKTGGGNDNAAAWQNHLPKLIATRTKAAVVMIDHVSKGNGGRMAIGGQAKMAGLTGAAYVVEPVEPMGRGLIGRVRVLVGKDRPGHVRQHAVGKMTESRLQQIANVEVDGTGSQIKMRTTEPEQTVTTEDRAYQRLSDKMNQISLYLQRQTEGASGNEIQEAVGGKRELTKLAKEKLIELECVTQTGQNRTSRYHFAKAYGANEEGVYKLQLAL